MLLAKEFLAANGNPDLVVNYLDACDRFWGQENDVMSEMATTRISAWKEAIVSGNLPDFGANLYY